MFSSRFLSFAQTTIDRIDPCQIERMAELLQRVRERGGRLFLLGSGGGAGHASHAVCDFRKLCEIESYCPTDNVSELTARINDEGWDTSLSNWLIRSNLSAKDAVLVFSVGGGSLDPKISVNLVNSVALAKERGAAVLGVVGRDGGYVGKHADACVIVPTVDAALVTPITESFQALVWHLLVSHPRLQKAMAKWESTRAGEREKETHVLKVGIFADGADLDGMLEMYGNPMISGFTTNPTLMRKAGITNYETFARGVLTHIKDKPVSFEVLSDDLREMEGQANRIASWGDNVYVKIPITNTKGESCAPLMRRLGDAGVKVNCTAVMTMEQVHGCIDALGRAPAAYLSIFAGRIADTGRDPLPLLRECVGLTKDYPTAQIIWASPRELLNIIQADQIGCHVITVTNDILKKLGLIGKDLSEYSRDTVKMFYNDARSAGFSLDENMHLEQDSRPPAH